MDYLSRKFVCLVLYAALRLANPSLMAVGTVIAFVGIAIYFTVNLALAMLDLSHQFAKAETETHGAGCVVADQAVLAIFRGTSFIVHYILIGIAGMIVSTVMLRSTLFSRATSYAGLLQGAMMLIPSTGGAIGLVFSVGSLLPFSVWFILIGRRLLVLARHGSPGPLTSKSSA